MAQGDLVYCDLEWPDPGVGANGHRSQHHGHRPIRHVVYRLCPSRPGLADEPVPIQHRDLWPARSAEDCDRQECEGASRAPRLELHPNRA